MRHPIFRDGLAIGCILNRNLGEVAASSIDGVVRDCADGDGIGGGAARTCWQDGGHWLDRFGQGGRFTVSADRLAVLGAILRLTAEQRPEPCDCGGMCAVMLFRSSVMRQGHAIMLSTSPRTAKLKWRWRGIKEA